jgi:hypothetical protein
MPTLVVNGAVLACTFGVAPASLVVLPANRTEATRQPGATIMDHLPMTNIQPFGMCMSPANPQVAAATAAAMGVLTPQPCIPNTVAPWSPGSATVMTSNIPTLNDISICNCLWAGVISVSWPGQQEAELP